MSSSREPERPGCAPQSWRASREHDRVGGGESRGAAAAGRDAEDRAPGCVLRQISGPGGKWQISAAAADDPLWSRTRQELFFAAPPGLRLMVAGFSVEGESFRAEKPKFVSEARFASRPRAPSRDIALHPDGQRFAVAPVPDTETSRRLDKAVFIFNFFDELRRIAPARK